MNLEQLPVLIGTLPVSTTTLLVSVIYLLRLPISKSVGVFVWALFIFIGYFAVAMAMERFVKDYLAARLVTWDANSSAHDVASPEFSGWYVGLAVGLAVAIGLTAVFELRLNGIAPFMSELIALGFALVIIFGTVTMPSSHDANWAFGGRVLGWTLATAAFAAWVAIKIHQRCTRARQPAQSRYSIS